jgi:hypothetical protein
MTYNGNSCPTADQIKAFAASAIDDPAEDAVLQYHIHELRCTSCAIEFTRAYEAHVALMNEAETRSARISA